MTDRTIRVKIIDILQTDDCGHKCSKCTTRQIYGTCETYNENRRKARRIMSLFKKRDGSTEAAKK